MHSWDIYKSLTTVSMLLVTIIISVRDFLYWYSEVE